MKGSRRFPVLGTGHADCRNFSPRDPAEPAEPLSPVWRPQAPTPSVMGRAVGPAGSHPRPACLLGEGSSEVLAGPAVQVQIDPLAVRSHTTGSGGRPAPRGAGDLARAAASRLRRHRPLRRGHRPHCRPTRRRLRSSLPHQEQVNEFGPTGLQPVPTRPAGRKDQGRPLWALTSGLDRSCDETSKGASAEVAMAPRAWALPGPAARVQASCGT